jgi:hypothetical protein
VPWFLGTFGTRVEGWTEGYRGRCWFVFAVLLVFVGGGEWW